MEQSNILKFSNELIRFYQCAERKFRVENLQQNTPPPIAHLFTAVTFVAMGLFAYKNSDKMLLGGGAMAGLFISFYDPTCGKLKTPQEGALLGITKENRFALQKVYLVATLLGKNYAIATGFFMANAFVHAVRDATTTSGR